jgi:hypothetical protein
VCVCVFRFDVLGLLLFLTHCCLSRLNTRDSANTNPCSHPYDHQHTLAQSQTLANALVHTNTHTYTQQCTRTRHYATTNTQTHTRHIHKHTHTCDTHTHTHTYIHTRARLQNAWKSTLSRRRWRAVIEQARKDPQRVLRAQAAAKIAEKQLRKDRLRRRKLSKLSGQQSSTSSLGSNGSLLLDAASYPFAEPTSPENLQFCDERFVCVCVCVCVFMCVKSEREMERERERESACESGYHTEKRTRSERKNQEHSREIVRSACSHTTPLVVLCCVANTYTCACFLYAVSRRAVRS